MAGHPNNICPRRLHNVGSNYKGNIEYTNFDNENIAMKYDPNFYNPKNRFYIIYGAIFNRKKMLIWERYI